MSAVRMTRPEPRGDPSRLRFWCPGCDEIHDLRDGAGQWSFDGNFERPTLSPSVKVTGGGTSAVCHSFVRAGRIEFLGDCTHKLVGQTVDLPTTDTWPDWAREVHS